MYQSDNLIGFYVDYEPNNDSISFISSIVSLEEEFNIEFPDEYLLIEKMNNINNICLIIESLLGS